MFDLDNWNEIWNTISRNKVRSLLTGFGVSWGIFMLILLVGLGNGFKNGVDDTIRGVAMNSCFFYPGKTSEPYKGYRKGRWWSFNQKDIDLIQSKAVAVENLSPVLYGANVGKNTVRGMNAGSYGSRGVYPAQFKIELQDILYGRLINDVDLVEKRKVCVIGREVYETLFSAGENPLGEYIRHNGIWFQIVGVIKPVSTSINVGGRSEATVFIPFTTMKGTFYRGDGFHFLACTAKPGYPAKIAEEEVKSIVKAAHNIAPGDPKAVGSFNVEEQYRIYQSLVIGIDILIWIVGLGALFSGIIGISNIMLVTIRERTREIGVRRALGAKPGVIIRQILAESFVLTGIAGMGGFVAAIYLMEVWGKSFSLGDGVLGMYGPPVVSFGFAIFSVLMLVVSGLVAGLMPAIRALQIKAIDALRDE